jgi:hypothetical protein
MIVPVQDISIAHPSGGAKMLQYSHIIENAGDGPLELLPNYDSSTNTATAVQNLYSLDAAGNWSVGGSSAVSGLFTFHDIHHHYHFPLASYGLYTMNADGSVGTPMAVSAKVGYCISENTFVEQLPHSTGSPRYDENTCSNPTAVRGIAVGYGDKYDWTDFDQSIDITNLADGTYWFVSTVDPNHRLLQKNQTSHTASLVLKIAGDLVTVQSASPLPPVPAIDQFTFVDSKVQTATAPSIVVSSPNQLLLAFAASDGPADAAQSLSVSGGGLSWKLEARGNRQAGTAEIWSAVAPTAGASIAATATMAVAGEQSLAVVSLKGSCAVGAAASAGGSSGAQSVGLTTTRAGSWVFAVGNDWDHAIPRALGPNQTMLHQWVDDPVSDTFWSQVTQAAVPSAGTAVTMNDTAPTADRWNLAAVEVTTSAAPSPPPPGPPIISNVAARNLTPSSALVDWTTDQPSTSQVDYGTTAAYGSSTTLDATMVTQHSQNLRGLTPNTVYHYRVRSGGATGSPVTSGDSTFATPSFAPIATDRTLFQDGRDAVTTPSFQVSPGQLMLAFVASDGPASGPQSLTVSGGGLTWTLLKRVNAQSGAAEVWRASPASQVTTLTATSTPASAGYNQSLTIVLLSGAGGVGATAAASAPSGAPSVILTTSQPGSWVAGAGNDWDTATPRTLGPNQSLIHQWVESGAGNTFWAQSTAAPIQAAGTAVQINDVAPTTDRWNLAVVEVLAATS